MAQSLVNPALVDQLVARDLDTQKRQEDMQPEPIERGPNPEPIHPRLAMILGQAADSASTFSFLKNGDREANPALQIFNKKPWTVVPLSAGGALGYQLLHRLISKKSPKLADTLGGLLGGYHGALAGTNFEKSSRSGYSRVADDFKPRK